LELEEAGRVIMDYLPLLLRYHLINRKIIRPDSGARYFSNLATHYLQSSFNPDFNLQDYLVLNQSQSMALYHHAHKERLCSPDRFMEGRDSIF